MHPTGWRWRRAPTSTLAIGPSWTTSAPSPAATPSFACSANRQPGIVDSTPAHLWIPDQLPGAAATGGPATRDRARPRPERGAGVWPPQAGHSVDGREEHVPAR